MGENYLTRFRMFLHMVFSYAVQNGLILHNPVVGIRIPKTGVNENRSLTVEEQARLITTVRAFEHPVMFCATVALYTGCRKGEVLGLLWKDVDFEKKEINIRHQLCRQYLLKRSGENKTMFGLKETKTKKSQRSVSIITPLLQDFLEYREKQLQWKAENGFAHSENDFVFPSSQNTPLGSATFYKYYHKLLKKAELSDVNFHTLRHTFATRCLESGVDIITLSKTLGHSSVKVTGDIYTHMNPDFQRSSLELLNQFYTVK